MDIWSFPGPAHYEGDVLTFLVPLGDFEEYELQSAELRVDGELLPASAIVGGDPLIGRLIAFPDAFSTEGAPGAHLVEIAASLSPDRRVELDQRIVVSPAAERPGQETTTSWRTAPTDCCRVSYLDDSAASRDLGDVIAVIDEAAAEVEGYFGLVLPDVDFVLIDSVWGNGGYAGDEVVVSYLDRDFTPGRRSTFRQTVRHELAHAVTAQLRRSAPWPLVEGVAVQFTQGHFKPEPLGPRSRALADAGLLPPLDELFDEFADMQHETRYAAVGGFAEFLVAEFGLGRLIDLLSAEVPADSASVWLDRAATALLGVGLGTLQSGFDSWVASHEPGDQPEDLRLTVALQEARREFQIRHDPYPYYFAYASVTKSGQESLTMRDPTSPAVVAAEALIAYAQDLIIEGDLDMAAPVVAEVERLVEAGRIGSGIGGEFLAVAEAVAGAGLELVSYRPGPGTATAVVIGQAPVLLIADLGRSAGEWTVIGLHPAPDSADPLSQ